MDQGLSQSESQTLNQNTDLDLRTLIVGISFTLIGEILLIYFKVVNLNSQIVKWGYMMLLIQILIIIGYMFYSRIILKLNTLTKDERIRLTMSILLVFMLYSFLGLPLFLKKLNDNFGILTAILISITPWLLFGSGVLFDAKVRKLN